MFKKKPAPVDPILEQRKKLIADVKHARDILCARVQSAITRAQLVSLLPTNSKQYRDSAYELDKTKNDVLEWMTAYELCRQNLQEFCTIHNLGGGTWVSAEQVALWACSDYFKH